MFFSRLSFRCCELRQLIELYWSLILLSFILGVDIVSIDSEVGCVFSIVDCMVYITPAPSSFMSKVCSLAAALATERC